MLEIDQLELAQLIRPVGFFNHKAKYIKQTVSILTKLAEGEGKAVVDIPDTYEGLIALPGVGPKMATLVMNCAWNKYGHYNSSLLCVSFLPCSFANHGAVSVQYCGDLRGHTRASHFESPQVGEDVEQE